MPARLKRWLRTFHTLRHLQLRQAWYFFLRRGIGARRIKPFATTIVRRQCAIHSALQLRHIEADFSTCEFNFLNHTLIFPRDLMNWRPLDTQRLWRYNLHYFDFLRDSTRPLSQKTFLIDDWIANNPQGTEPAWEPYTTSLRIVNWCLFFWSLPQEKVRAEWLHSLYLQARWLECNLELHILANHYFENIKAMLFAALFFSDRASTKWLTHFQKELIAQLQEQTLADGGHYERSPQYHCILLEDYLDIYALLNENSILTKTQTLTALTKTIDAGLRFLALIATPDDDIPLFNDSASGAVSRPSVIFNKARRLGFQVEPVHTALINLPDSGLFGWKSGDNYFLIDCGDIGPAYQPGHTHCDFLSFVLMIDGQWIVVDSGVCEYEPGAMRSYVRSTAAHNTIIIDGCEQSEVWGEFRVGRRAKRAYARLHKEQNKIFFEGAYRGFPSLSANITHCRRAALTLNDTNNILELEISDTISGDSNTSHHIENLIHLHPALTCFSTGKHSMIHQKERAIAAVDTLLATDFGKSWYCPQFGLIAQNKILSLAINTALPATMSYRLRALH